MLHYHMLPWPTIYSDLASGGHGQRVAPHPLRVKCQNGETVMGNSGKGIRHKRDQPIESAERNMYCGKQCLFGDEWLHGYQ